MPEFSESQSLRSRLRYLPQELSFGTSGRRGPVVDLTQLEIYINALAELEYMQRLSPSEGGISKGDPFYFAYDLRPSSIAYAEEEEGRGEIAQAIVAAIRDAGMQPVNLGPVPTPALTFYALSQARGSVMITGSHIPFDRNGYKINTARGELRKEDEQPVNDRVAAVRQRLYRQPYDSSPFDERGRFRSGHRDLPPAVDAARNAYISRYLDFFCGSSLRGKRLLVYQHSAVARDLLVELLNSLGAETVPAGRSSTFVPIDTENIDDEQLAVIQGLTSETIAKHGPIDAVVSLDGDSDRPLILGVDPSTRQVRFFAGDLAGMIAAEYLGADAVVVPISSNDAIDRGSLARATEPKTRIGSPYVIAGMDRARSRGKKVVCGWEANGGFLTGSDIERNGRVLKALPTRDAFLPILCVLFAAQVKGLTLIELFSCLPKRFSKAALLKRFPRPLSLRIVERFSPRENGTGRDEIRKELADLFPAPMGFGAVELLDYTDGVRILFSNGDVAHIRPSGNADELRIYAVADTQARADTIAALGVAEPDGILRRMERLVKKTVN